MHTNGSDEMEGRSQMESIESVPELEEFFKHADYSDIKSIDAHTRLRPFVAGMLSYHPWWLVLLYRIRGLLVKVFGLVKHDKPEHLPMLDSEDISFTPGDTVSFFIVCKAREDRFWISETPEDKHLKACFGIVARKLNSAETRFYVFTTVRYLHWTGPVYFNLIKVFHHFVVWRMMKAGSICNI